jgi:hypothetical protein
MMFSAIQAPFIMFANGDGGSFFSSHLQRSFKRRGNRGIVPIGQLRKKQNARNNHTLLHLFEELAA